MNEEIKDATLVIAGDIFEALIDKHEGTIFEWYDEMQPFEHPIYSWIDSEGPKRIRVVVTMEDETSKDLTRAMYMLNEGDPVTFEDQQDAFGEIANVICGNIKSVVPDTGALTLPNVSVTQPPVPDSPLVTLNLNWKGKFLVISISELDSSESNPTQG